MKTSRRSFLLAGLATLPWSLTASLWAQPGRGYGQRRRRGAANDPAFDVDRELFHTLLSNRQLIRRKVTPLEDGVETVTETDDPQLRAALVAHVKSMQARVEEGRSIHRRDPLFREVFRNAEKINMTVETTPTGVRVRETSDDAHVVRLIQKHAEVVSAFLKNGHAEVKRNHALNDE